MRTWNIAVIAFVFIVAMAGTAEAQRASRPILNGIPVSRGNLQPLVRSTSNSRISGYDATSQRYPYVIALPEDRQWLRQTPIELRPNRPMHFWGNSQRRSQR